MNFPMNICNKIYIDIVTNNTQRYCNIVKHLQVNSKNINIVITTLSYAINIHSYKHITCIKAIGLQCQFQLMSVFIYMYISQLSVQEKHIQFHDNDINNHNETLLLLYVSRYSKIQYYSNNSPVSLSQNMTQPQTNCNSVKQRYLTIEAPGQQE